MHRTNARKLPKRSPPFRGAHHLLPLLPPLTLVVVVVVILLTPPPLLRPTLCVKVSALQ